MLVALKQWLGRYPTLYGRLRTVRNALWPPPDAPLTLRLKRLLERRRDVFFLQVGSNDGVQGDPIHDLIVRHSDWRGILIEPVPFIFNRLKRNYGHSSRFVLENIAIGPRRERREFYYVSEAAKTLFEGELPFWHDQLGSFDRQHILKHLNGALEPYIVSEVVQCVPVTDVLEKHGVSRIDLLHIDTEGYDFEVLRQIDLRRFRPIVVLYEHEHLQNRDAIAAEQALGRHGYTLTRYGGNTLAVLGGN